MFCASDWRVGHFGRLRRREGPAACAIGSPPRRRPGHTERWLVLSPSRHRTGRCDTSPPSGAFLTVIRRLPGRGRNPVGAGPLIRVCYAGREPELSWPVDGVASEAAGQRRFYCAVSGSGRWAAPSSAAHGRPARYLAGAVLAGAPRHGGVHSKLPSRLPAPHE